VKRSRINPISDKKAAEKRIEEEIRQHLLQEHGGICQNCGRAPGFLGLSLHHIVFKSRGGKTNYENCVLICSSCHQIAHGIGGRRDAQGRIF
jgi:5-methylcytosine-specific restriction endonuclease McrA